MPFNVVKPRLLSVYSGMWNSSTELQQFLPDAFPVSANESYRQQTESKLCVNQKAFLCVFLFWREAEILFKDMAIIKGNVWPCSHMIKQQKQTVKEIYKQVTTF